MRMILTLEFSGGQLNLHFVTVGNDLLVEPHFGKRSVWGPGGRSSSLRMKLMKGCFSHRIKQKSGICPTS